MSEQQDNKFFVDYHYDPSTKRHRPGEGPGRYYPPGDPRCSYYCDTPIDRSHRFKVEPVDDDVWTVPGQSELDPDDSVSQHGRRSRRDHSEDRRPSRQRERSVSVPGPRSPDSSPGPVRDTRTILRREQDDDDSRSRCKRRHESDREHHERRSQNPPSYYHLGDGGSRYLDPNPAHEIRNPLLKRSRRSQTERGSHDASRYGTREGERRRNTGGERRRGSAERRRRVQAEHPIMSWFAGRS